MKLYDKTECPFCWKVRLALHYKNIAFEQLTIDTENKPAEFLSLSPSGKVPLLAVNEESLSESTLIAHFLEDYQSTPTLLPGDAKNKYKARALNHYSDTIIGPAIRDAIFTQRNRPESEWDQEAISRCGSNWQACLSFLDGQLSSETYFCNEFSLAECALIPRFALALAYNLSGIDEFPRLKQWYAVHSSNNLFAQTAPTCCQ